MYLKCLDTSQKKNADSFLKTCKKNMDSAIWSKFPHTSDFENIFRKLSAFFLERFLDILNTWNLMFRIQNMMENFFSNLVQLLDILYYEEFEGLLLFLCWYTPFVENITIRRYQKVVQLHKIYFSNSLDPIE